MSAKWIRYCVLAAAAVAVGAHAVEGDEDKLKELEKVMRAGAAPTPEIGTTTKGKPRTRAIVFDAEPAAEAAPAPAVAAVKAPAVRDCGALSPDAPSVAVDFSIRFNVASSVIAPSSEETVSQIGQLLALNPSSCVIVEGHTDASGRADKNLLLSKDRANSVVNFLVTKSGIDKARLVPVGKGSTDPIKNTDPADAKNRRVVFKVVNG